GDPSHDLRLGQGRAGRPRLLSLRRVSPPAPRGGSGARQPEALARPDRPMGTLCRGGLWMHRLRKRGDVWYAVVYERGERGGRSTRAQDGRAAGERLGQWEREAADPVHAAAAKTSLGDALNLLLDARTEAAKAGRRSHDTVEFYRRKAGHLRRIFEGEGNFYLAELRALHVDAYISQRGREGAGEGTTAKELVPLRAALRLAKRHERWGGQIEAILPVAFAPDYKPRSRALSPGEVPLLLAELLPDRAARVAFSIATSACW